MTHDPGARIVVEPRSVYETAGDGWATARHDYRRARKVFWNFKYPAEALVEADAEEGLDVLIRRARVGDDPDTLARELETAARFAGGGWFLEPIDRIEDGGAAGLVLADPHADRLPVGEEAAVAIDRMLREFLDLLDLLHADGLSIGPVSADDFLLDRSGRWFFLGTDLIAPGRLPADDLSHWGRLVLSLRRGTIDEADPLIQRARRCLAPDPQARPASVRALRDEPGSRRGWLGWFRR